MQLIAFCRKVSEVRNNLFQQLLDKQAAESAENSQSQAQTSFIDFEQHYEAEKVGSRVRKYFVDYMTCAPFTQCMSTRALNRYGQTCFTSVCNWSTEFRNQPI